MSFHREHTTGTLLAHADNDVMVASEVINPLPFSTGLMLLIVFSLIALFAIDPLLTLVGLVLFPAMFVLNRFYTRRVELPAQTVQERVGDVSAITHESFEGAMVVKTLGRQDAEVERLGHAADQLRVARVRVGALRALFEPTLDALPNLAIIALLAVGGWRVSTGAVSPGDLVTAWVMVALAAATAASAESALRLGQVELLLAHHAFLGQPGSPFIICPRLQRRGLRLFQIGLGRNHIGLGVRQISLGLQQRTLKQRRIDLRHHLSFFHPRIEIGIQPGNGSGDLRADLDRGDGIDRSGGLHHLVDFAAIDLGGEILRLLIAFELKGGEDSYGHNHQTRDQPMAFKHVHDDLPHFWGFCFRIRC